VAYHSSSGGSFDRVAQGMRPIYIQKQTTPQASGSKVCKLVGSLVGIGIGRCTKIIRGYSLDGESTMPLLGTPRRCTRRMPNRISLQASGFEPCQGMQIGQKAQVDREWQIHRKYSSVLCACSAQTRSQRQRLSHGSTAQVLRGNSGPRTGVCTVPVTRFVPARPSQPGQNHCLPSLAAAGDGQRQRTCVFRGHPRRNAVRPEHGTGRSGGARAGQESPATA
jgi:hypothetical protein